jgi:hypothetical protein
MEASGLTDAAQVLFDMPKISRFIEETNGWRQNKTGEPSGPPVRQSRLG